MIKIAYFGGLGNSPKTFKKVKDVCHLLDDTGLEIEVLKCDYAMKDERRLDDLLEDLNRVRKFVEETKNGVDKVGIFGACYGAYLASRAGFKKGDVDFMLLAEPYFGVSSLISPYQIIASVVTRLPGEILLSRKMMGDATGAVSLNDLAKFVYVESELNPEIPTLGLISNTHHFFNKGAVKERFESKGLETIRVDVTKPIEQIGLDLKDGLYKFITNATA